MKNRKMRARAAAETTARINCHSPITMRGASNQMYYAGYAQDSWRINPRLTVNVELRYELQKARTERFDRYNYFDRTATNRLGARVGLPLQGGQEFRLT